MYECPGTTSGGIQMEGALQIGTHGTLTAEKGRDKILQKIQKPFKFTRKAFNGRVVKGWLCVVTQ